MAKRKPTIFDLMIATGFMMVLCAIPVGIVFGADRRPGIRPDLRWDIITGCVLSVVVGGVGGALVWIGQTVLKRRFKNHQEASDDVA